MIHNMQCWWAVCFENRKPVKFINGKCKPSTLAPPALSGGRPAGKQLCINRPGGAGGQVEHDPAACPCSKDGQQHPGLYLKALPECWGRWSCPSTQHYWDTQLECWVQYDTLNRILQRVTKMTEGLKLLSYKVRLRKLGLFRPEKRRLRDQSNQYALNTWPSTCPWQKIDRSQYHHQYHLDNLLQTYNAGIHMVS